MATDICVIPLGSAFRRVRLELRGRDLIAVAYVGAVRIGETVIGTFDCRQCAETLALQVAKIREEFCAEHYFPKRMHIFDATVKVIEALINAPADYDLGSLDRIREVTDRLMLGKIDWWDIVNAWEFAHIRYTGCSFEAKVRVWFNEIDKRQLRHQTARQLAFFLKNFASYPCDAEMLKEDAFRWISQRIRHEIPDKDAVWAEALKIAGISIVDGEAERGGGR